MNLIPMPYRILAVVLVALALLAGGFYTGYDWHRTKTDAAMVKEREAQLVQLNAQIKRADAASEKLAAAEGRIVTKTVEVIKYVPQVTTGRLCLDAVAVGMLQPDYPWGTDKATGKHAAESPSHAAASDRDVAYWIADANRSYETCAERLNALADWFDHDAVPPSSGF